MTNCLMLKTNVKYTMINFVVVMPDAIQTGCVKCSQKQKQGVEKTIQFLIKNKPEDWKMLKAKYDNNGEFVKKYEDFARKSGVNV